MNAKLPSFLQRFTVPLRPKMFSVRFNGTALFNQADLGLQIEQTMGRSIQMLLGLLEI
jgi:hypothetical protein